MNDIIIYAWQRHHLILIIGHSRSFLSDLNEASPNKADKGEKTDGHSSMLEISSKEELMFHCLKL
jgi:hypothetical protein